MQSLQSPNNSVPSSISCRRSERPSEGRGDGRRCPLPYNDCLFLCVRFVTIPLKYVIRAVTNTMRRMVWRLRGVMQLLGRLGCRQWLEWDGRYARRMLTYMS